MKSLNCSECDENKNLINRTNDMFFKGLHNHKAKHNEKLNAIRSLKTTDFLTVREEPKKLISKDGSSASLL